MSDETDASLDDLGDALFALCQSPPSLLAALDRAPDRRREPLRNDGGLGGVFDAIHRRARAREHRTITLTYADTEHDGDA